MKLTAKEHLLMRFQNGDLALKTVSEICKITNIPYREKARVEALLAELIKDG